MVTKEEKNLLEAVVARLVRGCLAFVSCLLGFIARNPMAARWQRSVIVLVRRGERPVVFRRGEVCG